MFPVFASWHASCLTARTMRNPLLLTSTAIACFALTACGGNSEPAKSPDDSAAEKASDAADRAEDRADKAADKASDAASDADKAEKENEAK